VFVWLLIGLAIYFTYNIRNSKVQAMECSEGKLSAERGDNGITAAHQLTPACSGTARRVE
jgi:hypothetical protein